LPDEPGKRCRAEGPDGTQRTKAASGRVGLCISAFSLAPGYLPACASVARHPGFGSEAGFSFCLCFRVCLSLLLLLGCFIPPGCQKTVVAPPYQAPPPPAAYSSSAVSPPRPVQVVEKSIGYLGGPTTIYHEIGPMETIWRISRLYNISPESIYSANSLSPGDPLIVGRKLIIPNATMIRHVINLYDNPQWKYIVVHHTATGRGNAKTIYVSHLGRGFSNGLGYDFLIDNGTMGKGDGQIEMGPRWIWQQNGAHCKADDMNKKAIGVALVGNFNRDKPTPNQLQSLSFLLSVLRSYYHIPPAQVIGHREVPGAKTECPGKFFPTDQLRKTAGSGN